jgi:hypothetical protein
VQEPVKSPTDLWAIEAARFPGASREPLEGVNRWRTEPVDFTTDLGR